MPTSPDSALSGVRSKYASSGASTIIPTIESVSSPSIIKPFLNSFPIPKREPKIRSNSPSTANIAIMIVITFIFNSFC